MKEKIENIVNKIFHNFKYVVNYYYDYVGITIYFNDMFNEISYVDIENLKEKLNSNNWWIEIDNGNIKLCYYIGNLIVNEFGNWENYDEVYGYE